MADYAIEEAEIKHSTDKAILVDAPVLDKPVWIPQSQVSDDSEIWKKGEKGTLLVSEWFAEKQGWL